MSINVEEQIPVGSRWMRVAAFGGITARVVIGIGADGHVRFRFGDDGKKERCVSDTAWWLANMRRIDVPATPVRNKVEPGMRFRVRTNPEYIITAREPFPQEPDMWRVSDQPNGHGWSLTNAELYEPLTDAPAPAKAEAEVCGFPGCNDAVARVSHGACVGDICCCGGRRQVPLCHDFVPQVKDSAKKIPAANASAGAPTSTSRRPVAPTNTAPGGGGEPGILRHDFSDRYCAHRGMALCVNCGTGYAQRLALGERCAPIPDWREKREREIAHATAARGDIGRLSPAPSRHHHQPSLSVGLALGGGATRCGCKRCAR